MAIESINCPNCGAAGINIDTAREHSFCSYCGTTILTRDVMHLDVESMTLEKLKRNALRSFEVGQYDNARADWQQAIQLDRTDYESYWGLIRCHMIQQPDDIIDYGLQEKTLAYAPPKVKKEYGRQMDIHNDRIHAAQSRIHAAQSRVRTARVILLTAALLCGIMSCAREESLVMLLLTLAAFLAFILVGKKRRYQRSPGSRS